MKTVTAIVNARMQSRRLPGKLTLPFAGTTLLDIALEKLTALDGVGQCCLGAGEDEIIAFAARHPGVEVLRRAPEAVAPGNHPHAVQYAHFAEAAGDWILEINPSMPFLGISTLQGALRFLQESDYPSYTSAVETGDWVFDKDNNALTNSDPGNLTTNKGKRFLRATHAFNIVNKAYFLENGVFWSFSQNDPRAVSMPEGEAVGVHGEIEFRYAEYAYRKRASQSQTE